MQPCCLSRLLLFIELCKWTYVHYTGQGASNHLYLYWAKAINCNSNNNNNNNNNNINNNHNNNIKYYKNTVVVRLGFSTDQEVAVSIPEPAVRYFFSYHVLVTVPSSVVFSGVSFILLTISKGMPALAYSIRNSE